MTITVVRWAAALHGRRSRRAIASKLPRRRRVAVTQAMSSKGAGYRKVPVIDARQPVNGNTWK
jgi:hypothetical protein